MEAKEERPQVGGSALLSEHKVMGTLKRRIIEAMEPKEEPPMEVLGWIPVEERLPDRYIRVLAFVKCEPHEHSHAIGFVGSLGLWSLDELHEPSAAVTHWMPLPEPPDCALRGE